MIDRHWEGIAAYCKPGNKAELGFVEGLNNKIRVMQRRADPARFFAQFSRGHDAISVALSVMYLPGDSRT